MSALFSFITLVFLELATVRLGGFKNITNHYTITLVNNSNYAEKPRNKEILISHKIENNRLCKKIVDLSIKLYVVAICF